MSLKLKRVELHKLCLLSECHTSLHIDLNKVKEINKCYEVVSENNSWEEQSKSEILRLGSSWLSYNYGYNRAKRYGTYLYQL